MPTADYSLVIVESPSKAKTIKKYLGPKFKVIASNGHVKDLPKSKLGVDVKHNFKIDLVPITGKNKIAKIKEEAKSAKIVFLALDPDREGEAIAFHIAEELGKKKMHRVLFNAITKKEVSEAINNPVTLDSHKYDSQKTRRVLDRLVGYKISPILWEKIQRGLSAGRVQSVALRIIIDREEEIKKFVATKWFLIKALFNKNDTTFSAEYYGEDTKKKIELLEEKEVLKIVNDVKKGSFKVIEVNPKERKSYPTPPFTTSKLQQMAATRLGFSAKKTMMVAQKLYEGIDILGMGPQGLITYMRTDSVRISPEAITDVRNYITKNFGEKYLPADPIFYKGRDNAQDAHEGIRPANLELDPEKIRSGLSPDEFKLYQLIWNKFVSSQMMPSVFDQMFISLENNGHIFKVVGSTLKFDGFRRVFSFDNNSNDVILPKLEVGEVLNANEVNDEEHWTTPPPQYTEAALVKELEENGIGRPSTYATITSNIIDRGYVEKRDNKFYSTELGQVVCKMLLESFPEIMNIEFTAEVEKLLDKIADNEISMLKVLKDFYKQFEVRLDSAKLEMKNLKKQTIPTGIKCEKCDGEYMIRWGKNGKFLACSNYPECNSSFDYETSPDGTIKIIPPEFSKELCPVCQEKMIVKTGRYGKFLACSNYPNCKGTLPFMLDVYCPECKEGRFAEKKSRYGKIFYGCSNYPKCTNALWYKPVNHVCPNCNYPIMQEKVTKKKGNFLHCPKCNEKINE